MSLYSDLNEVLTPYAQRIKGLAAANDKVKADLDAGLVADITSKYASGYITLNTAIGTTIPTIPTTSPSYKYIIVSCFAGDGFKITGTGAVAARLWAFCDKDMHLLRVSVSGENATDLMLLAETDGYFVSDVSSSADYNLTHYKNYGIITDGNVRETNGTNMFSRGYISGLDGEVGSTINIASITPSAEHKYTVLKWSKGDKAHLYGVGGARARLWGALDNDKKLLASAPANAHAENGVWVTAENDGYLVVCANTGYNTELYYYSNVNVVDIVVDMAITAYNETNAVAEVHNVQLVSGYYETNKPGLTVIDTDTPTAGAGYVNCVISVKTGEYVRFSGRGSVGARLWAILDSSKRLIENALINEAANNRLMRIPFDGYFVYNSYANASPAVEHIRSANALCFANMQNKANIDFFLRREYSIKYANAENHIGMTNYNGNSQNVHPKVLYFESGFGGHKYWMAYTPYPNGNVEYENPCIAYSDDGVTWIGIGANPLGNPVDDGTTNYNSDTHLVYNGNTIECWWRWVNSTRGIEIIYRKISSDGIHWGAAEELIRKSTQASLLSPTVIYDENKYRMWLVNTDSYYHIEYWESDENAQNWAKIRDIDLSFEYNGTAYSPWHLDVINVDGEYIALIMCKDAQTKTTSWVLFLTTSADNITYGQPHCVMTGNANGWDKMLYRSTIVKIGNIYRLYYSARDNSAYGIGISEGTTLDNFVGVAI